MLEIPKATTVAAIPRATVPKLKALTALRFFAAMHVVVFHMRIEGLLPPGPWWYENFAAVGYIGVNLFFVLSGVFAGRLFLCAKNRPGLGTPLVLFGVGAVLTLVLVTDRRTDKSIRKNRLEPFSPLASRETELR